MATIRKSGSGWQALIRRKGHNSPKSKTFPTRYQAESWARATEGLLKPQKIEQALVPLTLSAAIEAFIEGPLKSHRSAANELYPLRATAKSQG